MIALLTQLLRAAAEFLALKNKTAAYDLSCRIENDIRYYEDEIDRLRNLGGDANHARADGLRQRILRAQGIVANLPAANPGTASGDTGDDAQRNIHSAG